MPATPLDFHYMTVLRELEKAVTALHPEKPKVVNSQLADRVGLLYDKVMNLKSQWASLEEKIDFQLGAEQALQVKIEEGIIAHIAGLSGDRQHHLAHRRLIGQWPPMVPVARMVERFTALTIGLHSENPSRPLPRHVIAAFREAILPGLAWGLMVQLYARPKMTRFVLQKALGQHLRTASTAPTLVLDAKEVARVDYLFLVDAWFATLQRHAFGQITDDELKPLRAELAELIETDLGDLDTLLWERIGGQYLAVSDGSERAMAVARAEKHSTGSAAFLRDRLALFEAAQTPDLQPFRNQIETDLTKALSWKFQVDQAAPGHIAAGNEACGGAFWLARATFGQHADRNDDGLPLQESPQETASSKAVLLLMRAALMFKHQAAESDRLLTCLRYAAGYATNPRYCRSLHVLRLQERLVDLYEEHPLHRSSLVQIFRGRIAWQKFEATKGERDRKAALKCYYAALRDQHDPRNGFDAEAPVHFFPELTYLLRPNHTKANKAAKTLAAVDFITQRNYGVYFDYEREKEKLDAGFKAFARFCSLEKLADNHQSPLLLPSAETKNRLDEFKRIVNSAIARETFDGMAEISRALRLNR